MHSSLALIVVSLVATALGFCPVQRVRPRLPESISPPSLYTTTAAPDRLVVPDGQFSPVAPWTAEEEQDIAWLLGETEAQLIEAAHELEILNLPSLEDLYETTVQIQQAMQQKEREYQATIERLQRDVQEAKQQAQTDRVNKKYQAKVKALQRTVESTEQSLRQQEDAFQQTLQQEQQKAHTKEASFKEKIQFLTEQLAAFKAKAHQEQLEQAKAAQAKEAEFQVLVETLQAQLKEQIDLNKSAQQQATEQQEAIRRDLQQQIETLEKNYQEQIRSLQSQTRASEDAHAVEQRKAQALLLETQQQAKFDLQAALQKQEQASHDELQKQLETQKSQFDLRLSQAQSQAQLVANELQNSVRTAHESLKAVKLQADETLQKEQEAFRVKHEQLLNGIQELKKDLDMQASKTKEDSVRRKQAEEDLKVLQQKYDAAAVEWESKYERLQSDMDSKLSAVETKYKDELARAHEAMQKFQLESKEKESSLKKIVRVEKRLLDVSAEQHQAIRKEQEAWKAKLAAAQEELQHFKIAAHVQVMAAKLSASDRVKELLQVVASKDLELKAELTKRDQETERADENWQKRVQAEKQLSTMQKHHTEALDDILAKYKELVQDRRQDMVSATAALKRMRAESKAKIDAAEDKAKTEQEALQTRLQVAAAKEKKLAAEVEKMTRMFQEMKAMVDDIQGQVAVADAQTKAQQSSLQQALENVVSKEKKLVVKEKKLVSEVKKIGKLLLDMKSMVTKTTRVLPSSANGASQDTVLKGRANGAAAPNISPYLNHLARP